LNDIQWVYYNITSIARIIAVFISSITAYLWLSKRIISYKLAKYLVITTSLLTGIPLGLSLGWGFSILFTLFQTAILYVIVEIANRRTKEKAQEEKDNTSNEGHIL